MAIIIIIKTEKHLSNGALWTPEHSVIYENCNYIHRNAKSVPSFKTEGVLLTEKGEKSLTVMSNICEPHGL